MSVIREIAPAKLNLFLHITGRRDDGYHLLQSLFAFTDRGDIITAEPAEEFSLTVSGPFAATLQEKGTQAQDNIILRAAYLLQRQFGNPNLKARIHLEKNLPVAAGIGGGSSDAAAVIRALIKLWRLDVAEGKLMDMALELGADVPACLYGKPCLVEGIGEKITPFPLPDKYWCLLVNPGVAVSTRDIFMSFAQYGCGFSPHLSRSSFNLDRLGSGTKNDLQGPAVLLNTEIRMVLETLSGAKEAEIVRMSGSGATCFALFKNKSFAKMSEDIISQVRPDWWKSIYFLGHGDGLS